MGCKQSRVKKVRTVVTPSSTRLGSNEVALQDKNTLADPNSRDRFVWDWLDSNYVAAFGRGEGDTGAEEDWMEMGKFKLAEEFVVGDEPSDIEMPKPSTKKVHFAPNLVLTPVPFRPASTPVLMEEKELAEAENNYQKSAAPLEPPGFEASEGQSTFVFNHAPVKTPMVENTEPKEVKTKKRDHRRDLKKRKAKQQRREAEQIRRKRKKGGVAFADDDTLADLAYTPQMPEINYSLVLSV
ncbi:hypothetical protein QR680_016682 [Steinernema hermaphroditum]|uniref:Uncharacterized protein n=1 Tax=Steinernema hermaphroditum TaxID=289476 RepID=A0AA39HDX6_9BILA|nr:hypothetical protein QR680_016682 [Steinernema hermaphroditum]